MIKTALLVFATFGILALIQTFKATHQTKKRAVKYAKKRTRRIINSEPVAKQLAESIVKETAVKHPEAATAAKESEKIPKELEKALEKSMEHFKNRVSPRFKHLFYNAINKIILNKP
jgi:hypothetical protein